MHDQARPVGVPTEDLTRAVGAVALAAVADALDQADSPLSDRHQGR
jgi:hypothetical protein